MSLLACSGEGALALIAANIAISRICAAIAAAVGLAIAYDFLRTRQWRLTLPASAALLAVHPAWSMSAMHGDCGFGMSHWSCAVTVWFGGMLLYQLIRKKRPPCDIRLPLEQSTTALPNPVSDADNDANPYRAPRTIASPAVRRAEPLTTPQRMVATVSLIVIAFVAIGLALTFYRQLVA